MKGILLLVLALLSILGIEAQWLNSNSNNQHTYNVPSANPLNAAPSKRWTLDPSALRVEHFDEPLYTNDSLLLIAGFNKTGSTYSHYLFGIDSSNGGVGWSSFMFSSEKGGLRPKYLGNGRIYTTIDSTPSAKIGCFDATSGQRLWVSPPLNVTSCVKSMIPVTDILESDDGSTVYAISGCVVDAYSTADGTLLWQYVWDFSWWYTYTSFTDTSVFVPKDNILIISYYTSDKKGDFDAETFAFDGKTGKQLWSVTTSASKMTLISPPNGHSLVLLPTQSGIVALDSVTGKQAWTYQSDAQNQWWSNVAADTDGNWYGVLGSNANGGNPLFAFSSGGSVIKSYTLDKNLICVDVVAVRGSSSFTALYAVCLPMSAPYFPKLYAVHATEGSVLWEYNYPEGQLIVGNTGKLFFFNAYDPDMQQNSELQAVW